MTIFHSYASWPKGNHGWGTLTGIWIRHSELQHERFGVVGHLGVGFQEVKYIDMQYTTIAGWWLTYPSEKY